jgi:hypothetical protein
MEERPGAPIYSATSSAFFFVGYGATRRVEKRERVDLAGRRHSSFSRAQRVLSLFEDAYSLVPLNSWLPEFFYRDPTRYKRSSSSSIVSSVLTTSRFETRSRMASISLSVRGFPFPSLRCRMAIAP